MLSPINVCLNIENLTWNLPHFVLRTEFSGALSRPPGDNDEKWLWESRNRLWETSPKKVKAFGKLRLLQSVCRLYRKTQNRRGRAEGLYQLNQVPEKLIAFGTNYYFLGSSSPHHRTISSRVPQRQKPEQQKGLWWYWHKNLIVLLEGYRIKSQIDRYKRNLPC